MTTHSVLFCRVLPTVLLAAIPLSAISAPPSFTGLGDLPGGEILSVATAVTPDGSIVMGQSNAGDQFHVAVQWAAGVGPVRLDDLSPGSAVGASVGGISADGSVATGRLVELVNGFPVTEAYRWTDTVGFVPLGLLPSPFPPDPNASSVGEDVSEDGTIVVGTSDVRDATGSALLAFRWTQATGMISLGDLGPNAWSSARAISGDGSVIVGQARGLSEDHWAFAWTEELGMISLGDLPGGIVEGTASGVSFDGSVIVGWSKGAGGDSYGLNRAFRWTQASGLVDISYVADEGGARFTAAQAVSDDGNVIVGTGSFGVIWDPIHGARRLTRVLKDSGLDLTGWTLRPLAISGDGQTIVGSGTNPDGGTEGWMAVVPEPSALTALGPGTAMLALLYRRRRHSVKR
jgi:probable HAF family extracellular repeat protein